MLASLSASDLLDLGESSNEDQFVARLVGLSQNLGFPIVSGAVVRGDLSDGAPGNGRTFGNLPKGYESINANPEDARRDPVLAALSKSGRPFVYRQDTYVQAGIGEMWEQQASYGFSSGIGVKIVLPANRALLIGVDGPTTLPYDGKHVAEIILGFQLLATNAAAAADSIFPDPLSEFEIVPSLTPKEIDVMKWTLQGKTAWEIGRILSSSEATIRFHIANVNRKFGISSKQQAALRCKLLGII